MYKETTALIVGFTHHGHIIITVAQSLHSRILAGCRCAHNGELMDLQHLMQNHIRCAGITETPSCHGIGLGKTVDKNRSLLHSRQRCNGCMRIFISQFTVNFITDNENIMFDTELCNRLQIFFRHNGACRIVRERQYQNLCLWCNRSFQFFCCQFKFIFFLKINNHRHTIRQYNARLIRNITWLRNNDLFTGIEHGTHGNIDGF